MQIGAVDEGTKPLNASVLLVVNRIDSCLIENAVLPGQARVCFGATDTLGRLNILLINSLDKHRPTESFASNTHGDTSVG